MVFRTRYLILLFKFLTPWIRFCLSFVLRLLLLFCSLSLSFYLSHAVASLHFNEFAPQSTIYIFTKELSYIQKYTKAIEYRRRRRDCAHSLQIKPKNINNNKKTVFKTTHNSSNHHTIIRLIATPSRRPKTQKTRTTRRAAQELC